MSTIGKKTPAQVQQLVAQAREQVRAGTLPEAELRQVVQKAIDAVSSEVAADRFVETTALAQVETALEPTLAQAHKDLAAAIAKKNDSWFGLGGFLPGDPKAVVWDPVRTKRAELEAELAIPAAHEVASDQRALAELNGLAQLAKAPKNIRDGLSLLDGPLSTFRSASAKAVVVMASGLGGSAKTAAALDFQATAASWSQESGRRVPWRPDAKALVTLAHVLGGDEKATAGLAFQATRAVSNTWGETSRGTVALAHVLAGETGAEAAFAFQEREASWTLPGGSRHPWPDAARAMVMLAHVLGGETNAAAAIDFQSKHARWGSVRWSVEAQSIVALARALSDEPRAAAAMAFEQKHARWSSETGPGVPFGDVARSLVALAHVLGGEERSTSGLRFAAERAKWPVGVGWSEQANALVALAYAIGGPDRTADAMDVQGHVAQRPTDRWSELACAQLVLATVIASTPDAELPLPREKLAGLAGTLGALLVHVEEVAEADAAKKREADEAS